MKNKISALMDGELFEDEAEVVFDELKRDSSAHRDWAVYHLIGDVLRQPEYIHRDVNTKVQELMRIEPTVFAPRIRGLTQKFRNVALSAVASLMALGVVAWMSVQITPESNPQLAMQQTNIRPVSLKNQFKSNDYLMAHQEFSPSSDMNGGATYVRTVSYNLEEKQ